MTAPAATSLRQLLLPALLLVLGTPAVARAGAISGRVATQDGKGIADAVVFVQQLPTSVELPAERRSASMDQVQKEFVPHVLPVVVGTEVRFPNHDQIHHHVYSFSRTKTFELPLYKGEEATPVVFDQVGAVKVGCNIHDWMSGVILVVPTPYYAVTGADGTFRIADVPAGTYDVAAWHEDAKSKAEELVQQVVVGDGDAAAAFTLDLSAKPRGPLPRRYE